MNRVCHTVASALVAAAWVSGGAAAGTPVLGGSAVLEQATRATLAANGRDAARFASSSPSAVLDWSKFNVGGGQSMTFDGRGTTFFNLVSPSAGKSQIDGMIGGSGSVWVINPSGIAFGAGAQVNVGGLFAAAGNVSNADALRNGTALVPEFSSLGGAVEVAGATFAADQVALMGKTVSAAGDFSGVADLSVGAGGRLTVDEVGGGRVTVGVAGLADDPTEVSAVLGDLLSGGDLEVVGEGQVLIEGDVVSSGGILIESQNGGVEVASDASIVKRSCVVAVRVQQRYHHRQSK